VVQGLVYVDSGAGGFAGQEVIYAFNESNGALRWRFTPSTPLGILAWLVDGGVFYAAEAGFPPLLVAADAATGTTRWQMPLQQVSGQITALLPGDATSLVLVADQTLVLVQRSTGAEMWRRENTHSVGLQVFADTIYTFFVDRPAASAGGPDLVGLRALKVADGSVLWSQSLPTSDGTYLGFQRQLMVGAITPEAAYLIDGPNFGDIHAWDLTGRSLWSIPGSDTYKMLAANDQAVFLASAHGVTALMGTTGKTLWHGNSPADVATMQVGVGGLYGINASNTRLYAFEPDSGKLLWTIQANQIHGIVV
jgi:outer membrane protein assembly factor BamB